MTKLPITPNKTRRLKAGYALINHNVLNFPLARDSRTKAYWRKNATGRWWCGLPGERRIRLRLPADFDAPRVLTGFDMAVLFALLKACHVSKKAKLEFTSITALAKQIGAVDKSDRLDKYNRKRLRAALHLLGAIIIRYTCWYKSVPRSEYKKKNGRRGQKDTVKCLRPPIRRLQLDRRPVVIVVSKDWRALSRRFHARVPLYKLPTNAATQNLVLLLVNATAVPNAWSRLRNYGQGFSLEFAKRTLCGKIGVNHSTRNSVLDHAIIEAGVYFGLHGFDMNAKDRHGQITFEFQNQELTQWEKDRLSAEDDAHAAAVAYAADYKMARG